MVCNNTLNVSRANGEVLFKRKATRNFSEALAASEGEVEAAVGMQRIFKESMESLDQNPCSVDRAERIYTGLLTKFSPDIRGKELSTRSRNQVDAQVDLFRNGRGNNGKTELDVLSGYTEYSQTVYPKTPEKAWAMDQFGSFADRKIKVYQTMIDPQALAEVEKEGELILGIA